MSDWITHRQPTKEDGDKDGEVVVRHGGLACGATLELWRELLPGTQWRHSPIWQTPPQPEPAPGPEPEANAPDPDPVSEPEPEATALEPIDAEFFPPKEIPEPIRTGAAPFYVVVILDDMGGQPGGGPIVWEHQIPAGTTLQAALQQQQRLGSRYGTTYLAECRIIPETARHAG